MYIRQENGLDPRHRTTCGNTGETKSRQKRTGSLLQVAARSLVFRKDGAAR